MNKTPVFIVSNRRPSNVKTVNSLRRHGYTGRIYLLLDDEDETIEEYRKNYSDDCEIVVFRKSDYIARTDTFDNFHSNTRTVLFARNAVFDVAETAGATTFIMLDDDYRDFCYRFNHEF